MRVNKKNWTRRKWAGIHICTPLSSVPQQRGRRGTIRSITHIQVKYYCFKKQLFTLCHDGIFPRKDAVVHGRTVVKEEMNELLLLDPSAI